MQLILIHRYGCHLCERMLDRLNALRKVYAFDLTVQDIDADAALLSRYDEATPVLIIDGEEICRYELDEERLQRYLSTR
jgi:hypothetical protein